MPEGRDERKGSLAVKTWVTSILVAWLGWVCVARADGANFPDEGRTVWILTGQRPAFPVQTGVLAWELYRQAFLIAARNGLGLETRDESLREWRQLPPSAGRFAHIARW